MLSPAQHWRSTEEGEEGEEGGGGMGGRRGRGGRRKCGGSVEGV